MDLQVITGRKQITINTAISDIIIIKRNIKAEVLCPVFLVANRYS